MMNVFLGLQITSRKNPVIKSIKVKTTDGNVHEVEWGKAEEYMDFIGELECVLKGAIFTDGSDKETILKTAKIVYIHVDNVQSIEAAGISFETSEDIHFLSHISVLCEADDLELTEGECYAMAM